MPIADLGIALVAFSPMANVFLTGKIWERCTVDKKYDYQSNMPQFTDEAVEQNQELLILLNQMAENKNAAPAEVKLAATEVQALD